MLSGMDEDVVSRLEQKAAHFAEQAERYRVAAEVLRGELRGTRPGKKGREAAGARAEDPHQNTAAMVEMALDQADRPLHPKILVEEMQRLGWQTDAVNPLNTARTAALRLVERGRIQRTKDGLYHRLGLPEVAPSPQSNGAMSKPQEAPPEEVPEEVPDPWDDSGRGTDEEPPF